MRRWWCCSLPLARRKLLPGLFHLTRAGFIPGCRIIGVSLDEIDAAAFRAVARASLDGFFACKCRRQHSTPPGAQKTTTAARRGRLLTQHTGLPPLPGGGRRSGR